MRHITKRVMSAITTTKREYGKNENGKSATK